MLGFFTKLYLKVLSLFVIPDPKVIFIILKLHDPSLSEFDCNIKPRAFDMSLVPRFCYKSMIIKKRKKF